MRLFKIIYLSIGIFLLSAVLFYQFTGLPRQDQVLVGTAVSLGGRVEKNVWPGLRIGEYPVAIRKGTSEYVIKGPEVKKRKPVLPVIACTAYQAEGEMNVFLPCKSELDSVGQIAEGLSTNAQHFFLNQFSLQKNKLTDHQYIAILYHETLHAFQFKYFESQLENQLKGMENTEMEELMAKLEPDPEITSLYDRQFGILNGLVQTTDPGIDRNGLRELFVIRNRIRDNLTGKVGTKKAEMILKYIDFTELVEGTARYVELKTSAILSDDTLQRQYLSSLQETAKGKEKYYRSGMALGLLLDKVRPGWKETVFSGGSTLAGLLESATEES